MVQVRVGDLGSVAIARYLVQRVAQAQIGEFKQAQAQYESTSTDRSTSTSTDRRVQASGDTEVLDPKWTVNAFLTEAGSQ